jgi:hypothetical protein
MPQTNTDLPNTSLMALSADYQRLMNLLMETGGEITPELEEELTINATALASKADKYDFILARLETEEAHWKAQADRYARVARACANAHDRLRGGIKAAMLGMGVTEIAGENACFKLTRSAPKLVLNERELHKDYIIETIVRGPNKDKIKGALKEGLVVAGAQFEDVVALRTGVARKVK